MRVALLALLLQAAPPPVERIVFLGDSITDGHTLPLLVRQSLGPAAPVVINAGVAGDTAAGMRKRLERDVLPRRPTRVALSAGINDVSQRVPPAAYEADVVAISDRLKREGIPLVILLPTPLGPKHDALEAPLREYTALLRRLAEREKVPVAETRQRMEEARSAGAEILEPDQTHLTFEGYRAMARAVLDALGHPDRAVPRELRLEPPSGLIREWRIRALPDGEMQALTLPQSHTAAHWWFDQERRRGFAIELDRTVGAGKRFEATTIIESSSARDVFFNTGADLGSITLNDGLLWKSEGWTGWHAGKERLPARLRVGTNRIRIECGTSFFLSVTDENAW